MARYNNGIQGPFSGKAGNVVGASSRGVNYLRAAAKPVVRLYPCTNDKLLSFAGRNLQPVVATPVRNVRAGFFRYDYIFLFWLNVSAFSCNLL